ncbi:MAG TPA: transglutaminase-like domain-containing protein, partial [Ilumatobacteraceae bacterium]|nr:transglutaminase-like domain-containing protein [Ilumatobacteraceae bacterium]
ATSSNPPDPLTLDLPSGFPGEVTATALAVTADAPNNYEKLLALQRWFHSEFTYDLTVQRGHSDNAMLNFLRVRRGYCEQFAGTFAAMARAIGIPSRVAVGYTPGELLADGKFHVYGRNAHAWPEVWFDDIGWVSFEPTPDGFASPSVGVPAPTGRPRRRFGRHDHGHHRTADVDHRRQRPVGADHHHRSQRGRPHRHHPAARRGQYVGVLLQQHGLVRVAGDRGRDRLAHADAAGDRCLAPPRHQPRA